MLSALAITGPTASGKTALSLRVAEELGCEIISLDSMQIYRGMNIGTAKATEEERARAPHHLLDIAEPTEDFSAQSYREAALAAAEDITGRGKIPLFVGGTGLYLDTLLRASGEEAPESSQEFCDKIIKSAGEDVNESLWQRLLEVDPESAEKTHKNNLRRVVRALEIYERTGKTKSYFDRLTREAAPDIKIGIITLDFNNRENLYQRVNQRVDLMMEEGLLQEVRSLYRSGRLCCDSTAGQAIGYKELALYLSGVRSLSECLEDIKLSSRRYAKRQLTWFRHEKDAVRIFVDTPEGEMRKFSSVAEECISAARALLSKTENY